MQSTITFEQPPLEYIHQGGVKVHSFDVQVRIPTKRENTSYLLYKLLGHSTDTLLISPTGATATESFYKPVGELRVDTNLSNEMYKSTNEEALRYWMLKSPEFVDELVREGWLYFPPVKAICESELRELGFNPKSERMCGRKMSVKGLLKLIELSDNGGKNLDNAKADLEEVAPFGDEMQLVYEGGGLVSFLNMPVKYSELRFNLRLDGLERAYITSPERGGEPTSLERHVYWSLYALDLSDLPEDAFARVTQLTSEYARQQGILYSHTERASERSEGVNFVVRDRNYSSTAVVKPDTKKVLDQAVQLREFVESAIALEKVCIKNTARDLLAARRAELDLPEPAASQ
jgi:hypothetical protein